MRHLLLFAFFVFCAFDTTGQDAVVSKKKQLKKSMTNIRNRSSFLSTKPNNPKQTLSFFGQATTSGYVLGLQYERKKSIRSSNTFSIFFSEIKSDKEEKFRPNNLEVKPFGKPKPYIFGKQNSLSNINLTLGKKNRLFEGLLSPSIDIFFNYSGGFSLGILKPYALKLKYPLPNNRVEVREEVYGSSNQQQFLNRSTIYGKANFKHTLNDIAFIPGLILGGTLEAEIGKHPAFTKSIQLGGQLLGYTRKMKLMVKEQAKAFYYNAFIGLRIGKRW